MRESKLEKERPGVWWARDAPDVWVWRVREWEALVWGGVISEVGWLPLFGAPPRRACVALRSRVVL